MTAPLCKDCVHYFPGYRVQHIGIFGGGRVVPDPRLAKCKRTDYVDGSGKSGRECERERFTPAVIGGCDAGGQFFVAAK